MGKDSCLQHILYLTEFRKKQISKESRTKKIVRIEQSHPLSRLGKTDADALLICLSQVWEDLRGCHSHSGAALVSPLGLEGKGQS